MYVFLNPPYGKRTGKVGALAEKLYYDLSCVVQSMAYDRKDHPNRTIMGGYCLCPDEGTWKAFANPSFRSIYNTKTRHFTHGGMDMRIIAFTNKLQPTEAKSI